MSSERKRVAGDSSDVPSNNGFFNNESNSSHNQAVSGTDGRRTEGNPRRGVNSSHRHTSFALKDFLLKYGNSNPDVSRGRRKGSSPIPRQEPRRRATEAGFVGNRGAPSLLWRSGLREPIKTSARGQSTIVTLFVDNIPRTLATSWLRHLFRRCGKVVDLFISTKVRKSNKNGFGFVRYDTIQEAKKAIAQLNGLAVQGRELKVSMARYQKGGTPVQQSQPMARKKLPENKRITQPAFRDHRKYSEVVRGFQEKLEQLEAKLEQESNTIPIRHSIKVIENQEMAAMLNRSVIAENSDIIDPQIKSRVAECVVNETGMYFLSPTKLLIVFATTNEANNAVSVESPLWNVFDDVRNWSEGEVFDDRLVWIECIGMHPVCWNKENLRTIGEKWGPVIHIDSTVQGLHNISGARILVRTKSQNRIDDRIKLFYENGSCDIWVKECYGNCDIAGVEGMQDRTKLPPKQVDETREETVSCSMTNTQALCSHDPLIQEMGKWTSCEKNQGWVDPIIVSENICWDNVVLADSGNLGQYVSSPLSNPNMANKSSRPRGRPKKSSNQQTTIVNGMLEARKTWDTAQLLGISSNDEGTVLSELRKSKRILIMEGKGT